ncbi:MAG: glycoside hydrolase family 127 protein, partial [Candidatus Hydrogenedentes bacterium]|nr:glycoside hydrolase family 127 protein [Candidatus Hydrogenedentota bacterium]
MQLLPKTFGVLGGALLIMSGALAGLARAGDAMTPLEPADVKVGGEIGRRIDVMINNNLLVLNADKDFLAPFQKKDKGGGYIGLGKLIDATVRFAAYTRDEKVLALKKHLVQQAIAAQEPDGYLGMMQPAARMWGMWDIHEMHYVAWGHLSDYRFFSEKPSLEAARKIADYILQRWPTMPKNWDAKTGIATHVAVTGLERTMVALSQATGDRKYADFCLKDRALAEWDLPIVIGRRDLIQGHIYAYMCRSLAQLEL